MDLRKHFLVLAGGKGERLWPISTEDQPKQFLKIFDQQSLFEKACAYNADLFDEYHILSQEKFFFQILDQIGSLKDKKINCFLEPFGRGTLPILVLTLLTLPREDYFFLTPSDHYIPDQTAYVKAIQILQDRNYPLALLGKIPEFPHTGYGYLSVESKKVLSFIEKPNKDKAEELIVQKALWNLGMIYGNVGFFLKLVQELQPKLFIACQELDQRKKRDQFIHTINRYDPFSYSDILSLSIDRAILEKCRNLDVLQVDFSWQDMGSIQAIEQHKKDNRQVSMLNSSNISVKGNTKGVIVQNLNDISIYETESQIFILKS